MPENPIALNIARIIFEIMTNARGYRIDKLKQDLQISDRTYRKYRALIIDNFEHLLGGSIGFKIREIKDGEALYMRLLEPPFENFGNELYARIAALFLAKQLFYSINEEETYAALEDMCIELEARTNDKKFIFGHLLGHMSQILYYLPDAPKDYKGQREALATLLHSLLFKRKVMLEYCSAEGNQNAAEIEPLTLVMHRSALYLIARYSGHTKLYTFAVDRILSAKELEKKFVYPDESEYSPQGYLENSFGIFAETDGKKTDVELVFADKKWLKTTLKERMWHKTQKFEELKDGRLKMTFSTNSMVEVWPWIRSFGEDVKVIKPKERAKKPKAKRAKAT